MFSVIKLKSLNSLVLTYNANNQIAIKVKS